MQSGRPPPGKAGGVNKTMKKNLNKEQWIAMFKALGLDEATMKRWHQLFETRHPEAHQGFLKWLEIEPGEITRIRQQSR